MGGYAVVYVFLFLHLPITLAFLVMFIYDIIRREPILKNLRKEGILLFVSIILLIFLCVTLYYCTVCEF
jgi:hypothetical protein